MRKKRIAYWLCFVLTAVCLTFSAAFAPAFADGTEVLLTDTKTNCTVKNAQGLFAASPVEGCYSVYQRFHTGDKTLILDFTFEKGDITGLSTDLYDGSLVFTFWIWIDNADLFTEEISDSQVELNASGGNDDNKELHWDATVATSFFSKLQGGKWNKACLPLKSGGLFGRVGTVDESALDYFRWYTVFKAVPGKERNILVSRLAIEKTAAEPDAVMSVSETLGYTGAAPTPETIVRPPLNNGFHSTKEPVQAYAEPNIDKMLPKNGDSAITGLLVGASVLTVAAAAGAGLFVWLLLAKKKKGK
ncbi:hypothetical protein FACS1894211_07200 [Clostridia bacterium]|nr:hypothetical protein FACS1894211_07200 [Clostridia bacterium]